MAKRQGNLARTILFWINKLYYFKNTFFEALRSNFIVHILVTHCDFIQLITKTVSTAEQISYLVKYH